MKIAHRKRKKTGFTLIEILVVITIIGILSGLMFTGAQGAMNAAKKAATRNEAYNVRNAVSAYFTEYRRMPLPDSPGTNDYVDLATDEDFMDILLAAETPIGEEKNPRGIPFYTGKAAKPFKEGTYIKGVNMNKNGGGSLWDSYGRMFGVRIDTSNRNRMENPYISEPNVSGGGKGSPEWGSTSGALSDLPDMISETCAVWSSGKDEGRASDNIVTW